MKGNFDSIQKELQEELSAIDSGRSSLMELEEFGYLLEESITKNVK